MELAVGKRVTQWWAHCPLVLKVPGSIPAAGEETFGIQARFPSCHLHIWHENSAPSFEAGR